MDMKIKFSLPVKFPANLLHCVQFIKIDLSTCFSLGCTAT